jgi:putative ABC transport system permease protein
MSLRLVLSLAARNLRRNTRRSLLTASSVLFCVALLILGISWLNGVLTSIVSDFIATTGPVRLLHREYARKERLLPLHLSIEGVAALRRDLRDAAPDGVHPRITFGAMLLKGEDRNAPGFGRGIETRDGLDHLKLGDRIYDGRMLREGSDDIVVGKLLAEELDLAVGEEITVLSKGASDSIAAGNYSVSGLFDAGSGMLNRAFYVDLASAQGILDMEDRATEIALFGPALVYRRELPPAAARVVASRPDLLAQHWLVSGGFASAFNVIKYVIGGVAGIVMFVSGLGVLNTMMMAVMERRRELGVLIAQGAPLTFVVAMILLEAILLGVAGASGGVLLGSAAAFALEVYGVNLGEAATRSMPIPVKDVIHADLTLAIVLGGFSMGLLVSAAGALGPALRATRIAPAEALRVDA